MAGSDTHLTLYNLLTHSAEWSHPLPVAALAADPVGPHFAVVLPPGVGGVTIGATIAQQAAGPSGGGGGQAKPAAAPGPGALLVFRGAARAPAAGWALRRPDGARPLFALPRTPLHGGAVAVSLAPPSPPPTFLPCCLHTTVHRPLPGALPCRPGFGCPPPCKLALLNSAAPPRPAPPRPTHLPPSLPRPLCRPPCQA